MTSARNEARNTRPTVAAIFRIWLPGLTVAAAVLSVGCSSFKDVRDLEEIQDTAGFYPKAVFYCGSDGTGHYFEQETPLADLTFLSRNVNKFMVSRQSVRLPENTEFLHTSYTGKGDLRRQKLIIRTIGTNSRQGWAEYPSHDDGQ